jgi:AcrR family transcriptional regulator
MPVPPTPDTHGAPDKLVRSRDAAASRLALLVAGQALFGQQGYEGTTIREIGERAGVDAALIARYFGSKADLYIAAMVAEGTSQPSPDTFENLHQIVETMVTRTEEYGPGPVVQALIRTDTSEEIRRAAQARLRRRLADPLIDDMQERAVDRPQLRAEVALAALIGISLGRSLHWFDEMSSIPRDELVELAAEALGRITGD